MQKKKNVRCFINSKYPIVFCLLFCIVMILMCILPFYAFDNLKAYIKIIWICVCAILLVVFIVGGVLSYETATLSEEGISFQRAFFKVSFVKWSELKKIEVKELPTFNSRGIFINAKWIILYFIDSNKPSQSSGRNVKDKLFRQIKYTNKNFYLLEQYCKKYCSSLEVINCG